MKNFAKRFS